MNLNELKNGKEGRLSYTCEYGKNEEEISQFNEKKEQQSIQSDQMLLIQQENSTQSEKIHTQQEIPTQFITQKAQYMNEGISQQTKEQSKEFTHSQVPLYLRKFLQNKRYQFDETNCWKVSKTNLIKYYTGFILFQIYKCAESDQINQKLNESDQINQKLAESDQINQKLNELLEEKDKNWPTFCDLNQSITIESCKPTNEQSQEPKKIKANLKDFKRLCKNKSLINKITRKENFQVGLNKINAIENQCKEKKIVEPEILKHIQIFKEFTQKTESIKKDCLNNKIKKPPMKKNNNVINKSDLKQLFQNPEIKKYSKDILNFIDGIILSLEQDQANNDKKEAKKTWEDIKRNVSKLFISNPQNSSDQQSKSSQKEMKQDQKIIANFEECRTSKFVDDCLNGSPVHSIHSEC